ncbi:10049_t:CDS:10 [Acaulospora morrowiae]|uniref:10049_t:CDS:1 n=1 Tax=Acaulospora morrowiae TaxID=94023 RepID=A0A9N8VWB5_9GLOM|nr:10049_t:CDS:10 [Acaulospora morrowiae]
MDKGTCKSGARPKITKVNKTPPAPKPKPPKLSPTHSNKIDSEPNSSSVPPKRVNPNIRGANINRLSSVFEDSRTVPSLPLSPKLPVPQIVKPNPSKKTLRVNMTSESNSAIDESSMAFGDLKAKFQQTNRDKTIPPISTKISSASSKNHSVTKRPDKQKVLVNIPKRTSSINKTTKSLERKTAQSIDPEVGLFTQNETELINASIEWVEASGKDDMPEPQSKAGRQLNSSHKGDSSSSNKKILGNPHGDTQSKANPISITTEGDFETKRTSIANLLSMTSPSSMRPQGLHIETSKALPPIPDKSPSQYSPPAKSVNSPLSDISRRSRSETSLPIFPNEPVIEEEDEHSIDLKRRRKLWNVIKELVETERIFLTDMELLEEVYYIQAQEIPIFQPYDCKTIFINLPEVIDFSADFLALLEASAGIDKSDDGYDDKNFESDNEGTSIGEAFVQMMTKYEGEQSRMETVYGEYCKRHEASVQKLQEFDNDEMVQGFLQKCKSQCEGRTRSWDIASLLIKPVQRVLKYPLLLQQILSLTKPSHPDYEHLQFSFKEITAVAERINDIKKRKDIVEKIVGNKKRNEAVIKHATGIAKPTEDELYNVYLQKFRKLEQQGKQLSLDIKEWVKSVKVFFEDQQRFATAIEEFLLHEVSNENAEYIKKITEYKNAVGGLASSCGKEMEEAIKKVVYPQIDKFLARFKAPTTVMRKREKKILDFDRANAIKARGATPDKSLQQSADAYVSISAQLREELPEFFKLMTQYFDIIVQEFIKIQARFYQQMDMDFRQYYCKFVDSQALELISNDRELVLKDFDIIGEYFSYYHGRLGMDDQLGEFILINDDSGETDKDQRTGTMIPTRRSEESSIRPDRVKGGVWSDGSLDRSSFYSNKSLDTKTHLEHDLVNYEFQPEDQYEDFRTIKKRQHQFGVHKRYATDSVLAQHQTPIGDDDDDDVFHDSLTGEEDDETLFMVQTVYRNKSRHSTELNFESGIPLKIIHINETGDWWFAVNIENGKRGWVDPAFVERIS